MTEPPPELPPEPSRPGPALPEPELVLPEGSDPEPEDDSRRYPSTIGGAFYLAILAVAGIGIAIAWSGDWRAGVRWLAGGLIAAGVLRLVLPRKDAGMLAVRHRAFDTILLVTLGGLLIFLSITIPNQPPV